MTATMPPAVSLDTPFTRHAKVEVPLICGPMYPCSNPELVAAASEAGALGIVQPISLTFVHGHRELRDGLRRIRELTAKPIGFNALIEASSRTYRERMERWVDVALEEGVRFFLTSLGNPRWIVDKVTPHGGVVYHDVTERKWAMKGRDGGVHGLIAVNGRAGGHAGAKSARQLLDEIGDLGLPVVCAGGIGDGAGVVDALRMGYAGVQMGTRFIATTECTASEPYKQAILRAGEDDIVLTERITGVPVAVIRTPYIERLGTRIGPIARMLFRGRKTKHHMRTFYALRSLWQFRRSSYDASGKKDYWQAGRSVAVIDRIRPTAEIVGEVREAIEAVGGRR